MTIYVINATCDLARLFIECLLNELLNELLNVITHVTLSAIISLTWNNSIIAMPHDYVVGLSYMPRPNIKFSKVSC